MKKVRKSKKKWPLVGIKRALAYHMLARGMSDEEVCEKLKIEPANLAKAKTPYFLKRVELMQLGSKLLAAMGTPDQKVLRFVTSPGMFQKSGSRNGPEPCANRTGAAPSARS